jgi:hypothetical protein
MKRFVPRAVLFCLAVLFLNACASQTESTQSGPPVAGEKVSGDSGFGAGMGPSGASGNVRF